MCDLPINYIDYSQRWDKLKPNHMWLGQALKSLLMGSLAKERWWGSGHEIDSLVK